MSVKLRITAWFTFMIIILMIMVVSFVFVVEDHSLTEDPTEELVKVVSINAARLGKDHDKDDMDKIKSYNDGVYCAVYNEQGQIIAGAMPDKVNYSEGFENGKLCTYETEEESYYLYDMKVLYGGENIWIRGIISTTEPSPLMRTIILLTCILLPIILVLSVSVGWIIAKHSLNPIDKIIKAVDSINDGDDLSERVGLRNGPSEMKKLSEEFDHMFMRLEKSFEAERQFASDVSHELKTPITVILAECHRAKRKELGAQEYKQVIDNIQKQGQHMSGLIEQLLSITRLQQGTEKFPLSNLNISEFVEACVEDFKISLTSKKNVEMNIQEGVIACYNPTLMSRVLFNLLDNAKKYTKEDGYIWISLKENENAVQLTVEDNGVGIKDENLEKIWNRFWQADVSRGSDTGLGLGLAMVKEMIEFQSGDITVESRYGEGTRFVIKLKK